MSQNSLQKAKEALENPALLGSTNQDDSKAQLKSIEVALGSKKRTVKSNEKGNK